MRKKEALSIYGQYQTIHIYRLIIFLVSSLLLLSLSACFKTNNTPTQLQEQTGSSSSSLDTANTNGDIDEWLIPLLSEYLADDATTTAKVTLIIKVNGDHADPAYQFSFEAQNTSIEPVTTTQFILSAESTTGRTFSNLVEGTTWSFVEYIDANYQLTDMQCVSDKADTVLNLMSEQSTFEGSVNFSLRAGEHVTCTFTNTRDDERHHIYYSTTKFIRIGDELFHFSENNGREDFSIFEFALYDGTIEIAKENINDEGFAFFGGFPDKDYVLCETAQVGFKAEVQEGIELVDDPLGTGRECFLSQMVNNNNVSSLTYQWMNQKLPESYFNLDATNFDATEGWTVYDGSTTETPIHLVSGGLGGEQGAASGYISVQHNASSSQWPYFTPSKQYYGDASGFKNGLISYYLKSDVVNPSERVNIQIRGGPLKRVLSYKFDSFTLNSNWTYYAIRLNPEGWTAGTTPATEADMDYVLADLQDIFIYGTRASSTTGLDSVVMQKDYTSSPKLSIPDNNPIGLTDTISVSESGTINDLNIFLDINHTHMHDLVVKLTHPDGAPIVTLINQPINSSSNDACFGDNIKNILSDEASSLVQTDCFGSEPAYLANTLYKPAGDLSFFDGLDMKGDWTLKVTDMGNFDEGTLNSWSLFFK